LAGRIDVPEAEIRGLIAELGLQDSVLLTGAVDDVAGLLAASDLCVYSSRSEGIPNGVVEAMAAGLPVAAIDIPGVREAVGQEGLSFLAADAETLAESINRLYENEQLRQQFGLIMRERAASEFSVEAMCRETVDFINRQLAAKSIAPLRDDRH
jgi:glycosyltransferase involved in cell wall biosynthesis